jgi:tetratricopeptide (TPR) repeat protein
VRLGLVAAGIVVIGVAAVYAVQRLNDAERYRRLVDSGEQALSAGNSYAAIEAFSGAIALRPDSMTSHLRRGEAYQLQRRVDDAARDFQEAARLQPGATDPLIALAKLHDEQGASREAAEWFGRAATIDRQSPALLYRLALARYRSGQPATAVDPLRQAITMEAGFDEALYLLGLALRDTQDPAGAIDALERAVRANPSLVPAREELADLYAAQGRAADQMTQLTALIGLDPTASRDVTVALAQADRGNYDSAIATLYAATATAGDQSAIQLTLGQIYARRAEATADPRRRAELATQAVGVLEQALGGSVRRSDGLTWYGRALFLRGDTDDAARILQEAVATTPFNRRAFLFLADAEEALGHPGEARSWLMRYDVLEGNTASASEARARSRRMGRLAVADGDYRLAISRLEPLLEQSPADVELWLWVAEARWHNGDAAGANAALTTATALALGDARVRRLRQLIK